MFQNPVVQGLKESLDANAMRQRIIASNVANIDTPGYKTRDVAFDKIFESAADNSGLRMTLTNKRHMQPLPLDSQMDEAIFYAYHPSDPDDGQNDVDIDREMVKSSETAMNLVLYTRLLKSKYQEYKDVIDAPLG